MCNNYNISRIWYICFSTNIKTTFVGWGSNTAYTVGDGTASVQSRPVAVTSGKGGYSGNIVAIAAASATMYFVGATGDIYAWGANLAGERMNTLTH
jgi:alpha-tubulin suppressor-like RCC1 family protein